MAIKPTLPRWSEAKHRDYVIVVDSSQSMVGERSKRAHRLVEAMIAEMDRTDHFNVLACDVDCRPMRGAPGSPSSAAAREAAAWLAAIEPAGASNLVRALERAGNLARRDRGDRDPWVVYVGDGIASIGHRRPAAIAEAVAAIAERGVSFTTVGIGADADAVALGAVARAGGGQFVPYVPGQRAAVAAMSVLETTWGVSLRDPAVTLPPGLADVAPRDLATVRAGGEILLAARFEGEIEGEVVLRGTVGGKPYEDRFPIELQASAARGNAFVPRMWAGLAIADLELSGSSAARDRIVGLSKAFGVLSRHTSLLVLESEAMFRAFGVDRGRPELEWIGEEDVDVVEASGKAGYADEIGERWSVGSGSGAGRGPSNKKKPAAVDVSDPDATRSASEASSRVERTQPPAPTAPTTVDNAIPFDRRGGRWMKREWFTTAAVAPFRAVSPSIVAAVSDAEAKLRAKPDSRERHRALVQALSYAGELDRALEVARSWHERDRMDPQALIAIADALGRLGERTSALRMLSGVVDIRPDDELLQNRLAAAYARIGEPELECDHRVAVAEVDPGDADGVAAAARCLAGLGRADAARRMLADADGAIRIEAERVAALPGGAEAIRGQLVLDATWLGSSDLDLSLITPQGARLSWMGGRRDVAADSAGDRGRERLSLRRLPRGNYVIEVSRADAADASPVSGTIEVIAHGERRRLAFELTGARAAVGRIAVSRNSRLVEVNAPIPRSHRRR
jgi:tetratricopeptide (TPR) repeat protein